MLHLHHRQAGPALVVIVGLLSGAIAPWTVPSIGMAQQPFPSVAQLPPATDSRLAIPAGTKLPVRYDQANKIVILPSETLPLTLTLTKNIRSATGQLLVPAGSQVRGQLQPIAGGSQFVADELIWSDGRRVNMVATSNVITRTMEVRPGVNTNAVWKGAAIGSGAAAIISGLAGNRRITLGKVVLGAGAGALGGLLLGKRQPEEVIVINPTQDLTLTLEASLNLP